MRFGLIAFTSRLFVKEKLYIVYCTFFIMHYESCVLHFIACQWVMCIDMLFFLAVEKIVLLCRGYFQML